MENWLLVKYTTKVLNNGTVRTINEKVSSLLLEYIESLSSLTI